MAKAKSRSRSRKRNPKKPEPEASGPRPFWSGTISFGLVSVPVSLFPAVRGKRTGLRLLDRDGTPLLRRYVCPQHQREVHPEHVLRGYEVSDGEYVVVRDDELESLAPERSRDIDLRRFVPREQLPPALFERGYFLVPDGDSNKAYRLLVHTMRESDRAGIATFVMRGKEYLIAILAEGSLLRAETLRFADELRTPADIGLPEPADPPAKTVGQFQRAIKQLASDGLDREAMRDDYAANLRRLVERKRRTRRDVVERDEEQDGHDGARSEVDLLDVIRRSMERASADRNGHGTGDGELREKSKNDLYETAQQLDIAGRSRMTKQQLVRAIRRAQS